MTVQQIEKLKGTEAKRVEVIHDTAAAIVRLMNEARKQLEALKVDDIEADLERIGEIVADE